MRMIIDAIKSAPTQHVVYFLLTAYVEARAHGDTDSVIPPRVKRLPITGNIDVDDRLCAMREAHRTFERGRSDSRPVSREAIEVFTAASQRVRTLPNADHSPDMYERIRAALSSVYDDEEALAWLSKPQLSLSGRIPARMIAIGEGQAVLTLLEVMSPTPSS